METIPLSVSETSFPPLFFSVTGGAIFSPSSFVQKVARFSAEMFGMSLWWMMVNVCVCVCVRSKERPSRFVRGGGKIFRERGDCCEAKEGLKGEPSGLDVSWSWRLRLIL